MKSYCVAGKQIRGFVVDGEIWFIGQDVARAIGTNPRNQQWKLEDGQQGLAVLETKGGPQTMKTISAAGLVSLAFRSKRPESIVLREWAYGLMLPYLRLRIEETRSSGVNGREEREARRIAMRVLR